MLISHISQAFFGKLEIKEKSILSCIFLGPLAALVTEKELVGVSLQPGTSGGILGGYHEARDLIFVAQNTAS